MAGRASPAQDLRRHGVKETGREGLPAESVLRYTLLKQHRQLSYEEPAFHLDDSASFRAFARLPLGVDPKKSVLHRTISAIRAETWQAINRVLLASARQEKLETGKLVRLDSTITAALMHYEDFKAAGRPVPLIIMGVRQDEVALWSQLEKSTRGGYKTMAISSAPGVSPVAFWVAQQILGR